MWTNLASVCPGLSGMIEEEEEDSELCGNKASSNLFSMNVFTPPVDHTS